MNIYIYNISAPYTCTFIIHNITYTLYSHVLMSIGFPLCLRSFVMTSSMKWNTMVIGRVVAITIRYANRHTDSCSDGHSVDTLSSYSSGRVSNVTFNHIVIGLFVNK